MAPETASTALVSVVHPLDPETRMTAVGAEHADRRRTCEACGVEHPDGRTVRIAVDDLALDLRLCPQHAVSAREHLLDWLILRKDEAALGHDRRTSDRTLTTQVRAWAVARGYPVAKTGSVSRQLIELYRGSHAGRGSATP